MPAKTHIQKLLFSKDRWTPLAIRAWVLRQPRSKALAAAKIDDLDRDYHVRQRDPEDFISSSFRTIPLGKGTGIQAVIGHLRPTIRKDASRPPEATGEVDPMDIEPLHGVRDREKLDRLVAAMKERGWDDRPILVEKIADGAYQAWTGSHRLAAARKAGLDEVPVYELDADAMEAAGYARKAPRRGALESFREAMDEDDDAILAALHKADPDAARLFYLDVER